MAELLRRLQIPGTDVYIPRPGFGVYLLRGDTCEKACTAALLSGYRHIDSAQLYRNDVNVDAVVHAQHAGLGREDVFLTTKISRARGSVDRTYDQTVKCVDNLGGKSGYVDLFLIHVPHVDRTAREELWLALERLYREGRAKAIGVSNYRVHHLEEMREYATVWPPHVNQIEVGQSREKGRGG